MRSLRLIIRGVRNVKTYENFILVADVDGTLANSDHKVSQKNKDAIDHFIANGGQFAIATGRTQRNVVPYIEGVTVNAPCILYNGGALFSWEQQRFLKIRNMESRYLANFLRQCMELFPHMCIEIFTEEQLYVVTNSTTIDEHIIREKQEFSYATIDDILEKSWIKIILCDSHENLLVSRQLLSVFHLDDKTNNFFSAVTYLEIVDKGVSKGKMLGELLKIEEHQGKKVIATGDFQNDIEMLQLADYGIAPANAQGDVKRIADIIGVSNDDDLIHDIVYRIIPTL